MKQKIIKYFKKIFKILKKPEMEILPSNIAFNIILALIPTLTIIAIIATSFDISMDMVEKLITRLMPSKVSSVIIDAISSKGFTKTIGVSNLLALLLASNGAYAIITASDTLYKTKEKDNIKKRVSSVVIILTIITLLLFLLIVPVFGESIINLMHKAKILEHYIDEIILIYKIFKWPSTLIFLYFNIKLIYTIAPTKKIKSKETTYGALFTTIMWVISTIIFKIYLQYFARYDVVYGNLSSIIILLIWFYVLSYIFVFGLAINATRKEEEILEKERSNISTEK